MEMNLPDERLDRIPKGARSLLLKWQFTIYVVYSKLFSRYITQNSITTDPLEGWNKLQGF